MYTNKYTRCAIRKYTERIETENGRIVRTVTAHWSKTTRHNGGACDVYRIDDEGNELVQHLLFNCYGGYFVDVPTPFYTFWDEPGMNLNKFRKNRFTDLSQEDADTITAAYPDFKYVLAKAGTISKAEALNLLIDWKKDSRVELLVGAGYKNLLHNGNFARFTDPKKKAVLRYLRENPGAEEWTLEKLLFVMNRKGTADEYDAWLMFRTRHGTRAEYRWWKKYGPNPALFDTYRDYLRMADRCGHDIEEEYWKYPKDIGAAHDKVFAEYERLLEAEEMARKKADRKFAREKKKKFLAAVQSFKGDTVKCNGIVAYIPQDIETVRAQAKELSQCLVAADYIGSIAQKRCLLVFLKDKAGKPLATAEILPNGTVGQFYADQKGRTERMHPDKPMWQALDKWLSLFKKDTIRSMKKKAA